MHCSFYCNQLVLQLQLYSSLTPMFPTQFDSLSRSFHRSPCRPAHSIWPSSTFFSHSSTLSSSLSYFCSFSVSLMHFLVLFTFFFCFVSAFSSGDPPSPSCSPLTLFSAALLPLLLCCTINILTSSQPAWPLSFSLSPLCRVLVVVFYKVKLWFVEVNNLQESWGSTLLLCSVFPSIMKCGPSAGLQACQTWM